MRIQSKFKDFYDFVSHRFGADPDVVYERKNGLETTVSRKMFTDANTFRNTFSEYAWGGPRGKGKRQIWVGSDYEMQFVVAGTYCFALAKHKSSVTVPLSNTHDPFLVKDHRDYTTRSNRPLRPSLPTPKELEALVRIVGTPVFLARGWNDKRREIQIYNDVPVLADLGIPALVTPEQMWQSIYSTIINVLRSNPDKAPPVQVAEKYRIEGAGFDLKTSFRHPVNSPAAAAKRK